MANLTLRIEDRLLKEARKVAAARETTVNRMIRDFLARETDETGRERESRRALGELFEALDECDARSPVPPLERESLHDRR